MLNKFLLLLLIFQILPSFFTEDNSTFIEIKRSKSYTEQTGSLTPLVVTLSSEDIDKKVKGVDLICIIDVSGSMDDYNRITLAKESLNYLVKIMNDQDKLGIIKFESKASTVLPLTQMSESNKTIAFNAINGLRANGGTNIYTGLQAGLNLIEHDYLSGERVASMILLSDGEDNVKDCLPKFQKLINDEGKANYAFTLHTLGYGESHDAKLMHDLSLIRDGGYFFIRYLSTIKDAILEIYGALSTNYKVNVGVTISSNFNIDNVYGKDDMYQYNLINNPNSSNFTMQIIQFVYGKRYNFVTLVDIPEDTPQGTIVLTVRVSLFGKEANYLWDNLLDSIAYEEYVRGISSTFFETSYNKGQKDGITIMNSALIWAQSNYTGIRDWVSEYNEVIIDLNNINGYGKANILSKLRELKTSKLGIHYSDENSYQRKLIDGSYGIDTTDWIYKEIREETTIIIEEGKTYIYLYLSDGIGKINNIHFSGKSSSLIYYSDTSFELNIKPISSVIKFYYFEDTITRMQSLIDFSSGGKFVFKKDFPFEFYTPVDGTKDITFNIQFLKLDLNETDQNVEHNFIIKAYILDSQKIENLKKNPNVEPDGFYCLGYYDIGHRIGKIVLEKENIANNLSFSYNNYLYITVSKSNPNITYANVEGQFLFVPMDYTFSSIPESFYIFSNLSPKQKTPHLYAMKMEPELGKKMRIEFSTFGNELNFKILKYQTYIQGSEEYFQDFKDFEISKKSFMGKTYIDITQAEKEEEKFDSIIVSIFSKNIEHIAGNDLSKLNYVIRYTTYSDSGIYTFNDLSESEGNIEIIRNNNKDLNISNINILFKPLKYKKNEGEFIEEKTRFYMKLFPVAERSQKKYESIALFEEMLPILYQEEENQNQFNFQVNSTDNYLLTTYTISNSINEILSYKTIKIRRLVPEIKLDDENLFEHEYDEDIDLDLEISNVVNKNYLQIKLSEFLDGEYGALYIKVGENEYKSIEPSNNLIIIPSSICQGKKVKIQVKLKDGQKLEYYLEAKLVDQVELNIGDKFFFDMLEEYKSTMKIKIENNNENKMNIFIQSTTGDFQVNGFSSPFIISEMFGAKSINVIENSPSIEINAKTGEYISLYTHNIDDINRRLIRNYDLNIFGFLDENECIYFEDEIKIIERYQVRLLSDKVISIQYDSSIDFEFTEPGVLYIKEFSEKLNNICLKPKNDLDSIFFSLQIIDISDERITKAILLPTILGNIYIDKFIKDEVRYYRQGLFDSNPNDELKYYYNIRQVKGEIQLYITQCEDFPNCHYSKDNLENNKNVIKIYNLDEYFIYSKKARDLINYDPKNFEVYVILCKSDSCEISFIIEKSTTIINLSKIEKYSSKLYANKIDKYSVTKIKENVEIISVSVLTHSGEIILNSNKECQNIKYINFGSYKRLEIPKICGIDNEIEIYVQANKDSVYSVEYEEIENKNYSKIKSNIVHIEEIFSKVKIFEFTPIGNSYIVKFIPINCEINVKYEVNGEIKIVGSYQNIYVFESSEQTENIYLFEVSTKEDECMIYTYLEELSENFYPVLSDKVPYYLSFHEKKLSYKLIYPIPNSDYSPSFKINFFEETPINIIQLIGEEKEELIEALFSKDIITNSNILKKCEQNNVCYLVIDIKYEKKLNKPIIIEIIPKSNNLVSNILLDNHIRQDFISINQRQQYIAKIFKGEEGEVHFNYKYFYGELIGKLIKINNTSSENGYNLLEESEILEYDYLEQKLIFTKKDTEKCENICDLIIEVHPFEKYSKEIIIMDYSIYIKKSKKIVNLKLNEVIFGTLSKTIEDNYIEYYSIEIPYSTHKIFIDYFSDNTNIVINSGYDKPTKDEKEYNFTSTGKDDIFIIEDNTKDFKGENFIIGIYTNKLNIGVSQYSFKIRAEQELFPNYIISDMSKENICITKEKNQICYFIIPIIKNQKNLSLFLYAISTNNSDNLIISYKKIIMNQNIIINGKYIDNNIYIKTSKEQFIKNMLYISNSELDLNEDENILIKIESPEPGTIKLFHSFKSYLFESLLNSKTKEIFYLSPNSELYINIPGGFKSLVYINAITGKSQSGYENDLNNMQEISGRYSSIYLQSIQNNENRIKIKTNQESNFAFYVYMKIQLNKRNINEINLGSAGIRKREGFPIEFYSKISEIDDYIINFNLNHLNFKEIEEEKYGMKIFKIKAYIVTEEIIEKLLLNETFIYNGNTIEGKYEISFSIGKIVIIKEYIERYYSKEHTNYIYLVIEDSYNNPTILNNILGEITILQNNNIHYIAPNNIYINSNLEKGKISVNKYKFIKKNSEDKIMRIEFSHSSNIVKYKMYYNDIPSSLLTKTEIDFVEDENLGKKIIDINLDNNHDTIIFEVYNEKEENDTNKLSYSLRYRTDKEKNEFKNYSIDDDIKILEEKKDDNYRNISLSIPVLKDKETSKEISAEYYLKIYNYSDNDLFINNTISIIDNLEPYHLIKFTTNDTLYKSEITIPNDNKKYYIVLDAINKERELFNYKSMILDIKKSKEDEGEKTMVLKWYWILLIVVAVIIFVLVILIYCLRRRRKNEDLLLY